MTIEVLYLDGCPSYADLLPRLRVLSGDAETDATITLRLISDEQTAVRARFLGSPTVRVNDHDIEPGAEQRSDFGLKCRLYHTPDGILSTPPDHWLLAALRASRVAERPEARHDTSRIARVRPSLSHRRGLAGHTG